MFLRSNAQEQLELKQGKNIWDLETSVGKSLFSKNIEDFLQRS